MIADPSDLLSTIRRDRLRAIRELPTTDALPYALRRVVYTDLDAHVRAAAVRRLAGISDRLRRGDGGDRDRGPDEGVHDVEGWLRDALEDRSPMVRDAILRAIARCGTPASAPALRALVEGDRIWWIRRGAIYALAAIAGAAEVPAFARALGDPFWRVRQAAVRVLVVLGVRDPDVRAEVLDDAPASTTLTFLRSSWGPAPLDATGNPVPASALPAILRDPDPAVVTARLPTDPDVTPHAIVELLCDPHTPLRIAASERLVASGDLDAITSALDWLEEPRIPHVVDTVEHLLDHLGDPAAEIAARALARDDRPGGARWAIDWVVATHAESLYAAALDRARRGDASLRRAAIAIAPDDDLVAWAGGDRDTTLLDAIAAELHARRAYAALAALDASGHPRVRALQVDAIARSHRRDPDDFAWTGVDAHLADPHHGPRAIAARWLVRTDRVDPERLALDPDPAVREAALVPATAAAAVHDPDPWVARAAMRTLLAATRTELDSSLPAPVLAAILAAFEAVDPWLRQQACRMPATDPRILAAIVDHLDDRDDMVRAAAHDALEYLPESERRIQALLDGDLPGPTRVMAYTWLLRRLDDAAQELARTAHDRETDRRVRALLAHVAHGVRAPQDFAARGEVPPGEQDFAASGEVPPGEQVSQTPGAPLPALELGSEPWRTRGAATVVVEDASETDAAPRGTFETRVFGRAGFAVAPLAISGAYDVPARALDVAHRAGVDLFFWEPGYDRLTRFARDHRTSTKILTGTYHGDPRSIRLDVERALRTLRRDTLDGFLLFWTRSANRLDPASLDALQRLRAEGKLRAFGFSTHIRSIARDAIATGAWDVVMIRHSAAHTGIESEVLPAARETNTAIVTFSALTYGRMLAGNTAGVTPPTAAECYRYALSQPGVTAVISAPRDRDELVENLAALAEPSLSDERIAELRAHGAGVRAESHRFNTLLRQPTRHAAAAARELLASEPAPREPAVPRRLPQPNDVRRSRTRLGGTRRR